ncbi:hypothetical protein COCC4DRAFT_206302 [Bipolaris maydis ATCC 48331]|uniref:Uncharacterized protein n=2 Tax=Cochliobolus heterostrophus TaxID=5016 RepID=M2UZ93_COCH5|nr:uncharacterized protein COCC4DRAFT_206302 [Bipolaris maydis ATCC 48331]EMD93128.1 hypothetical protein COCHEDRAFT_1173024 [Bipolaris maydis C5]ENI00278.1 hypothetical protein COCC4DRAFT_206302 [Bipolaris maydis ATCC 48331]KAJ6208045.1 hypothetical protein PSV09DRAFT_1173024 [Bipolaris maydis]
MPPASSSFTPLNVSDDIVPEWLGSFTLAAPPNTDLWRKPPSGDVSTAPILYTALRNPFIAAEVTVSADWELEWDQGGLVIFAGTPPGQMAARQAQQAAAAATATAAATTTTTLEPPASKWVKVGLEFCNNACHATSVVANSDGADWSLSALPAHQQRRYDLRVKIERIGYALWVWYEDDLVGWKKLREVTWFFWGVEDKAVRVGVYASRPANFGLSMFDARRAANGESAGDGRFQARNLCVDFEGLEIF